MRTIVESVQVEIEVKRSRFIAHIVSYESFDGLQKKLREKHPKANHVVYAYRAVNAYGQIVENSSDDGEPRGCAGQPLLNVMRGNELVECAILVVRYFGGIKLGTGGMVRAYSAAAKAVVEAAVLQQWNPKMEWELRCDYSQLRKLEYRLAERNITIVSKEFREEGVILKLSADADRAEKLQEELKALFEY